MANNLDPRRPQVDLGGLEAPAIRPVASPVDIFVRPQEDSSLDQLGNALAKVSPDVRRFTGAIADTIDNNASEAGKQAAEKLRTEGYTLADATRKGLIPQSSNPYFMAGLREQIGRNMADKYDGDLKAAMAGDTSVLQQVGAPELVTDAENLQSSTNVKDYDAFVQKFRSAWQDMNIGTGDQDQHFNTGFQFRAGAYESQSRDQFANGIESKVTSQADDATFSEVYKHVLAGKASGLSADQIAGDINQLTNGLVQTQGRNATRTLQAAAKAVATAGVNNNDLSALDVLKGLNGKNGPAAAAMELYAPTRDKINQGLWEKNQRDVEMQKEQQTKLTNQTLTDAMNDVIANPNADLTKYVSQVGNDYHAIEQLSSMRANAANIRKQTTDDAVKRNLMTGIWEGSVGTSDIVSALNTGKLSAVDAQDLHRQLDEHEKSQGDKDPYHFKDPVFQTQLTEIKNAFADKNGVFGGDAADRARHAQAMLQDQWSQAVDSGKVPQDESAKLKWLNDKSDAIVKYLRHGSTFGSDTPQASPKAAIGAKEVPKPLEERLPKTQVLTADDFTQFQKGTVTPNFAAQARSAGITDDEQAEFIRSQLSFLKKKEKKDN